MASSAAHWWTLRARIAIAVFALSAVPVTVLLVRCGGDGGGPDAGAADAGPDRVIRPDTGADARDDGACSVTSDWPGFRRLTEFDPCAPADVLVDPDAGYTLNWTDCGDAGIPGCKSLVPEGRPDFAAYATHDNAGAGLGLALVQGVDGVARQLDVFDMRSSARLGEWRINVEQSSGTFLGLTNTLDFTTDFLGWRSTGFVAASAPASALAQANPMTLKSYPAPNQNINWAVSEQVMAFQPMAAPYAICQVATGKCVPLDTKSIAPAFPYLMFAWHDVVFATAEHGTAGWAQEYIVHADGSITLLRANPGAHVWGMATDGITLVWNETYGTTDLNGAQTKSEIWKAPFTTDGATLSSTATKVGTLPTPELGLGIYFNGIYLACCAGGGQGAFQAIQVASGATRTLPDVPTYTPYLLAYVDTNEIWADIANSQQKFMLVRIPFSQPWQ